MKNNLKEWKTTVLGGLILIAAAADLWHFERLGEFALGALAIVGIGFLFAPDRILNILMKKAEK